MILTNVQNSIYKSKTGLYKAVSTTQTMDAYYSCLILPEEKLEAIIWSSQELNGSTTTKSWHFKKQNKTTSRVVKRHSGCSKFPQVKYYTKTV